MARDSSRSRFDPGGESEDRIGKVLLEIGYITPSQLDEARIWQKIYPDKQLGAILIELGYLSPVKLGKGLGVQELERGKK